MSIVRLFPQTVPKAIGPYSPLTMSGPFIFISGQIGINPTTNQIDSPDIQGQTHQVMKNLQNALKAAGCTWSSVTKTSVLLTDMGNFSKVNQIYGSYFQKDQYPARVCYAVQGLPRNALIQIDAFAVKSFGHEHHQHQHHQHHEHHQHPPHQKKQQQNAQK